MQRVVYPFNSFQLPGQTMKRCPDSRMLSAVRQVSGGIHIHRTAAYKGVAVACRISGCFKVKTFSVPFGGTLAKISPESC
jgi:hypothetical protein